MPVKKTPTMTIRQDGGTYAVIPSATIEIIKNPNALAILVFLLNKSADWVVRRDHLRKRFSLGRHSYDKAMSELKDLGLVEWEIARDDAGKIENKTLIVSDQPMVGKPTRRKKPQDGKTHRLANPTGGESDHIPITDLLPITDKTLPTTHKPPENTPATIDAPLALDDGFDAFYSAYPKKVGKAAARKAWKKLKPPHQLLDTMIADIAARIDQGAWCIGLGKAFIPGPAVYLNQARWQDEIIPRPEFKPTTEQSALNTARMLAEMDRDGEWLQ